MPVLKIRQKVKESVSERKDFVGESLFEWIGVYKKYTWKHVYSFPIYIALAFFVRFLVGIFEKAQYK
jgi:hypothetical protein